MGKTVKSGGEGSFGGNLRDPIGYEQQMRSI